MIYYKTNVQYNEKYKKNNFNFNFKLVGGVSFEIRKNTSSAFNISSSSSSSRNELSMKRFNKKKYTFYMRNTRFHLLKLSADDTKRICKKENIHTIYDENNQNPLVIKNYL